MGAFFVYILKSAICLALFYLGYRLLLSRDTFLRFNRFALLSGFGLAALLPLVRVGVEGVSPLGPALEEW
ncbi:MAG: TonB-dependent receptor, partial [Parabacteroides sp.]|nr:TonB-dependent receptor [Parabacteroides sp.]